MPHNSHEIKDKNLFNQISKKYFLKDIYPVSSLARKFQLLSLIELYKKETQRDNCGKILELGCGVGASSKYLKELFTNYTGVDYSEEFIEIANKFFSDKNVIFRCANIKDYNHPHNGMDFIFGVGVLHHVSDLNEVLTNLKTLGGKNTIYGFIEPQSSNPFIQTLRRLRMRIDIDYSGEQIFFKKESIKKIFEENGFHVIKMKYQGYLTPPFAQIIIKPKLLFNPVIKLLIHLDRIIQNQLNNRLSWNIIWIAQKKQD